jgi:flagellar biosynthesis repressor protein FlbT
MALKVELKPGEKIIIGKCVVTNANQRTRLFINGHAPILREKDIMTVEIADTPAKKIYLAVQLMYLDEDIGKVQDRYFGLVNAFIAAAPSATRIIDNINNEILTGSTYKALKQARKLIQFEQELLANALSGSQRLFSDGETNHRPTQS